MHHTWWKLGGASLVAAAALAVLAGAAPRAPSELKVPS
jgi:hypothetical protein